MDKRPNLDKHILPKDFKEYYWLKEELISFCRSERIKQSGSKILLENRIVNYLKTGEKDLKIPHSKKSKKSKFDWNKETLSLETKITDNYKNTENVRSFFVKQLGKKFKFNVKFMHWIKTNEGKTLADAANKWIKLEKEKKIDKGPKEIAPQFEYNTYLRDFLKDNPDKNRAIGIQLWKIKKAQRGNNIYNPSDLNYLAE